MAETDSTLDAEVRQSFIDDLVQQGTSQTDAAARYDQAMAYKPTPAPTPDPVKVAKPPEVKLPEPPQMKEVKPPKITSQYGDTKDRTQPHGGIDIKMPVGTPIPSLSSGTVTRIVDVDDGDRGGMRVFVRDDKGRETRYMHGSGFPEGLKVGQEIEAGQPVMISGATGRVTGPHLHLEVGNVNESGQFNRINPADAYPQYFQTGAQPGAKPEVPEYLQPDFKLELPTMLNKLMATRQQMINGSAEGMSMQDQVARHARSIGLTADQFAEAVSLQGAGLEYMLDEVGRKGRNSFDVVEEAKKRGVSAFLDPSQRTAKVSKTAGGLRQKVVDYQNTGDPTVLTGEFSSEIFKSKDAMPFLGGQAIDFAETAKPDERMYKIAALIAEGVMKDQKASDGVSAWSEQYFGAAKWAKSRTQQYLQRYGITPGSANYEDEQRKYYQRSLRELSALKVVGLWTGPIMLPEADVFQSEGAKSLGDRFFDALSPTLEVVGIREEKGKPTLVVRQENAFQYFFNMVDIAGAGFWGAVANYDSDQSVLEDAVEGIENRRNPLEAAMDSEFADVNGYAKALAIVGGGAALIFTPDLLVGAGGVAKLTKKTLDAATTGRAATRAGELLGDVYKARTEGRFVDAAKIEGTLRSEFGQQGGIADLLDIMDAEAAKFIAKGNADILDPEFAKSLPGDLGKRLVAAHASLRKPMLSRGKGQGKTMFAQYGGKTDADEVDLGLYETQALLDDIQEAREAMVALGAAGRLPELKKQVLGNITLLRRQTGAKNDPEAARFIARLEESLVEAIENPQAWEKRFHGKNNLQSELAQIAALRGPTDEDIANATGKTLGKLLRKREDLVQVRKRIHRQLGMITTKAKNVEDPVVVLDRAKAAVLANNESRASAAELLRRSVLGSHKIKPVTILPRPGDGELMEVSAYGSRFSDQIQGAYKLTDEQANAVASVMDARARAWGAVNGEDPSKYYESVVVSGSAGRTEDLIEETVIYEMREVGNGLVEISTEELRKAGGFGLMFKIDGDVMNVKSVEVPEALRGRGIGQGLYLRAVKHAKSLNKGFSSDLAPSPEALEVYEALIKRGIPFERKLVDMPDGTQARQFVISAENMAKIDLDNLKDATGKASAAYKEADEVEKVLGIRDLDQAGFEAKIKELKTGNAVAKFLAASAESAAARMIAFRLIPHLDDVTITVLNQGVQGPLSVASGGAAGLSRVRPDTTGAEIFLRGSDLNFNGINAETALHELLHAATQRRILDGLLTANKNTELGRATRELNDLTGVIGKKWKAAGYPVVKGRLNMDELLAWGLSNKEFQDWLKTVKIGDQTAFNKFVRVIADLLGVPRGETNALSEVLRLTDDILRAPIEDLPKMKYLGDAGEGVASAAMMSTAKKTSRSVDILSDNRAVLNAFTNPTFAGVVQGLSHVFRRDLDGHDLKVVEEWCNVKNGNWTDIAEAKWANGFEEYLASGRVANDSLKATFEKFKVWLAESYRAVIGRPQAEKIPDEVAAVLDKLLKEQPPNRTPLQSVLDAMSVGDISKIEETRIDPYMFIAKEARKSGMKNSAPDSIMASLKKNGKVTFKTEVQGKKVWTDEDFAELQLKLETDARMSDEASLGTDVSFRAAAQATARESADEQISSFLSNEGTLYAAARGAVFTVLGGDTVGALRVLRPEARFGVKSVVTSVEQAYGDAITFVAESKYEGLEGLLRFLGGEASLKFRSGRDALSSGQDYMGATLDNIDEIFKQLDTVKVGVGKNRITALNALAKLNNVFLKYPKNPAKGLEALSKSDSKNIADALQLLLRDQKNPIFDHLMESFRVGGALRPSEARLVNLLLQATGQVPSKAQKLRGAERARFVIDGIENIYSREEALRAAVLFAGHGQAKIGRDIWAGTGISLSKDLVTAFTSWLNGEKISSELIPQMHDLVRRYGMRPEFIDDAVLETGFYVPKIARERLMEALKKGTLRRDPNQRFTENHLHGLFGTIYRYMKTRMTRGGVVLRQRYFLMNTIDHFGQMAMVSGYRPALVSTIRLSTQNVMVVPGIAHALRVADKVSGKAMSEGARRILQTGGDATANAIGKWLGVSKYRIEVNPILEGVARDGSTTFRLVDAKTGQTRVYKYQDIRDIAVQEGVFASFDTRALESSIKRGVNLQETALLSRLKDTRGEGLLLMEERIKDSAAVLTDIVSKTAETWSERERVGAMISLMEMGMEPRKAARLVIDGLFDYAGSMTKIDRNIFVNLLFPFWAFQKNANRLVVRQLFSPQGAYRMGVLRRSYEATGDVLTELLYDRIADPYGLDVERMPPELQDNYWFLRKSIELGYGPLEAMRNTEEGEKILAEIEALYGPIDQIDAEKREFLERGYGSPSKVPQDIKDALRLVFAGVPTGYSDDLGSTVGPSNMVSLASHIQNRLQNLQPQTAEGERFADYYSPKPGKSAVRSYNRDRVGFFISPRMTEDARKFMLMAKNDAQTGYEDEFIQVLFPDSTINAGFRHAAAALSMMWLTARSVYGTVTEDEDANIQEALLDSAIELMGDPINSPIPAAVLDTVNATEGAPPRRIDPDLARVIRRLRDMGFPLPMVTIIPAEQDLINPDEPVTVSAERAYMQGGVGSMLFSTSAFGELNDIYVRWSKTPLEERMGMEGEILRWAETVAGLQVTRVSRTETAKREAPRFTSTTTSMPRPK